MGKHWHVCSTTYGSPYTMCMETVVTEYQLVPPYYGTPQTEPGTPNNSRERMYYDNTTRPSALGMSDPLIESLEIPRKPSNPDYQNSHFLGHLLWDTNLWENSLEPFLVTFFGDTFSSSIIPHLDAFLMMFHLPKQSPVELQKGGYFELTFQTNKCFGS